ncbi:MAG: tRNA (N(6)-L-threonylcarbamoyladenosine(37)-C(2))-methylthiotransferase MtaB [Bacteroidales bacterium]|nr:tRNA (N(6)-L-threonylcarbamoyladenosine(37)-C(2))-methylthiotransferase MtaB [Bacteroidales bacterium]
MKTIAYITLGCKLNYAETSTYARILADKGYRTVSPAGNADVYVINTCSVTGHADKKCRNIISRLHRRSPDAIIAVTGCYAQLQPESILNMEGVDLVIGAQNKNRLPEIVSEFDRTDRSGLFHCPYSGIESVFPAYSSGERTRSFLKVQDGCNYFCSYCTVPYARGKSRNIPVATLVKQAEEIAGTGIREIVLTGVNIGDYGRTTGESFLNLLKALNEVKGIERYRISSIEPNLLTEEIVRWIAGGGTKFLPHFHIPIQSGCDRTLRQMHRRYSVAEFEAKIDLVRKLMETPEERGTKVFFGIDVIVGFPGETDEDFEETYRTLERIRPAYLHIFPYSRRDGTPAAARKDQVRESVKSEREAKLQVLCKQLHTEFVAANIERKASVLFESTEKDGFISGYTENYICVKRPADASLIGKTVEVTLAPEDVQNSTDSPS